MGSHSSGWSDIEADRESLELGLRVGLPGRDPRVFLRLRNSIAHGQEYYPAVGLLEAGAVVVAEWAPKSEYSVFVSNTLLTARPDVEKPRFCLTPNPGT
jgi:hypothetical protein